MKNIPRHLDGTMFNKVMDQVRLLGDAAYPTPLRSRAYEFPPAYPAATKTIQTILDPLGVFLFGLKGVRDGILTAKEMELQTAAFMTRVKAWEHDHPMFLVTEPLIRMLVATDRLDEPDIDKDSKPPFPAGHFILPKHLIGTDADTYVTGMSYAVLDLADFEPTPVRPPDDFTGRRFYITIEMNSGEAYFAKLHVNDAGVVENPQDSPYEEMHSMNGEARNLSAIEKKIGEPTAIVVEGGPKLLDMMCNLCLSIFTFLNLDRAKDTIGAAGITGIRRAKRNKPGKEFWKPAMIGIGMIPVSGSATQGSHASPHTHLRRGHWRWQHFGKGNVERKRVWIEPVLVLGRGAA